MNEFSKPSSIAVLYIDDEAHALKYFSKAFGSDYQIFTAESPNEGYKVLEKHADKIGIIVSDQRMPEIKGVEFLSELRRMYPDKVRILTTAYSDLESAIQSVNKGWIYQYVVKPWDLKDFQMILKRAADYYTILSERNHLMRLKMNMLQRIILSDRMKTLSILGVAMNEPVTTLVHGALCSLLQNESGILEIIVGRSGFSYAQYGLSELLSQERRCHEKIIIELLKQKNEIDKQGTSCVYPDTGLFDYDSSIENFVSGFGYGSSLSRNLEAFVSSLGNFVIEGEKTKLECETDSGMELRLTLPLKSGECEIFAARVFGILIESEPSPNAIAFFCLLGLATRIGISLTLVNPAAASDLYRELRFPVDSSTDPSILDDAIATIYESWDAAHLAN